MDGRDKPGHDGLGCLKFVYSNFAIGFSKSSGLVSGA
jgi:hypothetical protein